MRTIKTEIENAMTVLEIEGLTLTSRFIFSQEFIAPICSSISAMSLWMDWHC